MAPPDSGGGGGVGSAPGAAGGAGGGAGLGGGASGGEIKLAKTSWSYRAMFFIRPLYISVAPASEEHGTSFDRCFTFPLPPKQRSPRVNHPAELADGEVEGGAAGGERPSLERLVVPCTAPSTTSVMVPLAALVAATWCHSPSFRPDELISRRDLYSGAQILLKLELPHDASGMLQSGSSAVARPSESLPWRKLRPYAPPGPGPPHEARPTPPSQLFLPCSTCLWHMSHCLSHVQSSLFR